MHGANVFHITNIDGLKNQRAKVIFSDLRKIKMHSDTRSTQVWFYPSKKTLAPAHLMSLPPSSAVLYTAKPLAKISPEVATPLIPFSFSRPGKTATFPRIVDPGIRRNSHISRGATSSTLGVLILF